MPMAAVLPYPPHHGGLEMRKASTAEEFLAGDGAQSMPLEEQSHEDNNSVTRANSGEYGMTTTRTAEIQRSGDIIQKVSKGVVNVARKGDTDSNAPAPVTRVSQTVETESSDHETETTETVLRLSPTRLRELTSSPKWLPVKRSFETIEGDNVTAVAIALDSPSVSARLEAKALNKERARHKNRHTGVVESSATELEEDAFAPMPPSYSSSAPRAMLGSTARTVSTPLLRRRLSGSKATLSSKSQHPSSSKPSKITPLPLRFDESRGAKRPTAIDEPEPSPMPRAIPLPPLSLPTYLQLELSSQRPSPLYIHRSITSDIPYESSRVKIDRLLNFFYLPFELEPILWFGALACLDAWLFSFTILPLRFLKALANLVGFWGQYLVTEFQFVASFVYAGIGRMWSRKRRRESLNGAATGRSSSNASLDKVDASDPGFSEYRNDSNGLPSVETRPKGRRHSTRNHRRTKSMPSNLSPDHKADILKGLLILISCIILMHFDASRMYHGIRGQAAIKLYVIYNVLEVCDRLFSALGQDVLECLLSQETLERKPNGRSKIFRPLWLFILALCYSLVHSTALFYQVITLNVAVNSYSNALLTLLMSNQFVEIKSTVFKKFEKENLFQLTCADVVERFQLWLMLMIIASRNIIETGSLSLTPADGSAVVKSPSAFSFGSGILPDSFTLFPEWAGQIMGPCVLVLGSEMLVDWIKHAYITKFNNVKPAIYGRFLDVLAKDYYSNAFADQNLTRRLGLPVIPLACLFIRASVQTYHMFLATHTPVPLPSTATSISLDSATASPATTAAIQHIDHIFRRALGRSTFGAGDPASTTSIWNMDDMIALITMAVSFLVVFLVLLAFKLILGMVLLSFARRRYKGMKEREMTSTYAEGKRVGGWGVVEVDEDKRRWIYQDDPDGARKLREREKDMVEKERKADKEGKDLYGGVNRYSMVAKRIW